VTGTARVAIVEDHALFRETIASVVDAMPGFEVVICAGSADQAIAEIAADPPDLALVDVWLQARSGIEVVAEITRRWPTVRTLVVSGHRRPTYVESALAAGADGYVLKGDPAELAEGMQAVLAGETYLSRAARPPDTGEPAPGGP
jgi:DNA-binding NarL/FixJ family response regulator